MLATQKETQEKQGADDKCYIRKLENALTSRYPIWMNSQRTTPIPREHRRTKALSSIFVEKENLHNSKNAESGFKSAQRHWFSFDTDSKRPLREQVMK